MICDTPLLFVLVVIALLLVFGCALLFIVVRLFGLDNEIDLDIEEDTLDT